LCVFHVARSPLHPPSFPTRRSSDLKQTFQDMRPFFSFFELKLRSTHHHFVTVFNEVGDHVLHAKQHRAPFYQRDIIDAERSLKGDRKSTRLNSSHVKISYAVFCLKK